MLCSYVFFLSVSNSDVLCSQIASNEPPPPGCAAFFSVHGAKTCDAEALASLLETAAKRSLPGCSTTPFHGRSCGSCHVLRLISLFFSQTEAVSLQRRSQILRFQPRRSRRHPVRRVWDARLPEASPSRFDQSPGGVGNLRPSSLPGCKLRSPTT